MSDELTELDELRAENERLRTAIAHVVPTVMRYAAHRDNCRSWEGRNGRNDANCDCHMKPFIEAQEREG